MKDTRHLSLILCLSIDATKLALQHGAIQPRDRWLQRAYHKNADRDIACVFT